MKRSVIYAHVAEAGEVGVCWGTEADNLPEPGSVVQLLKNNSITMVRIYDTNSAVINALANTGIKLMVALPNQQLDAASSPSGALQWVHDNVAKYYPSTLINGITVGNEVFDQASNLNQQLVPAMRNVYAALQTLGLDGAIKVFTPVAYSALKVSWPPSQAVFRDDIPQSVIADLVSFLRQTGAAFFINVYPFRAYLDDPNHGISLEYWTFQPNAGVTDPYTSRVYYSLYDAQMDALRYAIGRVPPAATASSLRASLAQGTGADDLLLTCSECGCSCWNFPGKHCPCQNFANGLISYTLAASTPSNSKYTASLLGSAGGGGATSAFIFALFNEDNKPGDESERDFGIFYPNMQPVYDVDFVHGSGSWCVANAAVGNTQLWAALNWSCSHGADCSAIQPGARCFSPDTMVAHATYAFNDYYQRNGQASSACDFNGAGSIVYQQPSELLAHRSIAPNKLLINNRSSIHDTTSASDENRYLRPEPRELDWACGPHGADCFDPDTKVSHAFNDCYQRNSRAASACSIVYQAPSKFTLRILMVFISNQEQIEK
ncbi:hypothetical protein HU200_042099 [Digitaria exilis]|uniref:X8 domain-containing protein n=1 Tax=Digitaria exilis TaxID=1010633 RepID=A0A835BH34_9POAL|nr:hypothetical protein HU200_042099 [Digitaria exilis]